MAEIEILTNRDRAALDSGLCEGGRKALRIIDAHASDRAALVDQVAQLTRANTEVTRLAEALAASFDGKVVSGAIDRADTAEARVLEARDRASVAAREMSRCHRLWQEDKSKLAAANALLEECLIALFDVPHDPFHELVTNIRAHLSAQPAPLSDDLGDALAQVADAEHERAALSLGHPGADEVFARLREARQSAARSEPRKGEAFAKYHDEQASYGGVSWEFHARAATFCRDADERVATAESDLAQLRARVASVVKQLESGLQSRNYRAFAVRVLEDLRG